MDYGAPAIEMLAGREGLGGCALDGVLFEGVPLAAVARAYGTPTWVYGAGTLRARYRRLAAAMGDISIHYAVKANDHLAILALLGAEGAGADIVSGGELLRAQRAGIGAARIIFSGVGKTMEELRLALGGGVAQINVESAEELYALSDLAAAMGVVARVALRVNPDVDAGTHSKIATGRAGDKFGIPLGDAAALYGVGAGLPGLQMVGFALHIGSQVHKVGPFRTAYDKVAGLVRDVRAQGFAVSAIDCGGGLGVAYKDEAPALPEAWAGAIRGAFGGLDVRLAIEPGRWLVAPAGLLLSQVVRVRRAGQVLPIMVLDAAMNELVRPAMYGAWHGIVPVAPGALHAVPELVDVAGPVCESSDFFAKARAVAPLAAGDLVAILDAGAYGAVMSSSYNARPWAAQVMVYEGRFSVIRARARVESLWEGEMIPGGL